MNDEKINWYSISLHQKVEKHDLIGLKEAVGIVDRYIAGAGKIFETDKEAMAASMFGFSKSKNNFIEICVLEPDQFSYRFEYSGNAAGKWLGGEFRYEAELQSRDELIQKVTEFFSNPSETLKDKYAKRKRQVKSPLRIPQHASVSARLFTIIFLGLVGLGTLILSAHGIWLGKTQWGGRGASPIYEKTSPLEFWVVTAIFAIFGLWLIRGCVLESFIVQKMLKDKHKKK